MLTRLHGSACAFAVLALSFATLPLAAQSFVSPGDAAAPAPLASSTEPALPDSPGMVFSTSVHATTADALPEAPDAPQSAANHGPKYSLTVRPGVIAEPLTAKDKFILVAHGRTTLTSLFTTLFTTELGYLKNDVPHYGTNLPAFGQRFGAAEARATSQSFFSYGLYASLFRDDPRYYVKGPGTSIGTRAIYSATRVVITRKDDGRSAINWPKLAGVASATALTNAYYPDQDRRVGRTVTSILSSYLTNAGTNELREFLGDARHLLFHKH